MKARGWTSRTDNGHGGEVTDMQRSAYSARGAAGVPSGTRSRGATSDNSVRAGDDQV